jgi:predicted alpha/beta hydrolase family esterase
MRAFLILHGYEGSGPGHWQTWLASRLAAAGETVAYPALPDPDAPGIAAWRDALDAELDALAAPPVVLCHSLACILWLHHAAARPAPERRADRVLLVAPPSEASGVPALASFFPVPLDPDAVRAAAPGGTRLVHAPGDSFCPEGAGARYGEPLGLPTDVIEGGGHLNADAGYGAWPAVEAWSLGASSAVTSSRIAPG